MAQKVNIVLVDDIDGSDATETVTFGLDGTSYEIDLNEKNAAELRDALAGYVGHARKVGGGRRARALGEGRRRAGACAREVRDWARSNGFKVPDRGRVPADVREAFDGPADRHARADPHGSVTSFAAQRTGVSPRTPERVGCRSGLYLVRYAADDAWSPELQERCACSSGSLTEPAGWSCWPRKRPACSPTTTSAPSTSCSA